MADSARDTYIAGLTLLAKRELSEAQLRQRLLRKGHTAEAVEQAVTRLKTERALDDARVAEAIGRFEMALRGRGQRRARQRMRSVGIDARTVERAVDLVYADADPETLIDRALAKRLRGRTTVTDERERARLYRYLIGQGFESDRVIAALRKLSGGRATR